MVIWGILMILIGILMIHFQFKRRFFYKKRGVDDFYVPPEERGFWGIVIIMIFGGMILIFQSI